MPRNNSRSRRDRQTTYIALAEHYGHCPYAPLDEFQRPDHRQSFFRRSR